MFLENKITDEYLNNEIVKEFINTIKQKILSNPEIVDSLKSSNSHKIEEALYQIRNIVTQLFNDFQYQYFNPYNNKVAEMINEY